MNVIIIMDDKKWKKIWMCLEGNVSENVRGIEYEKKNLCFSERLTIDETGWSLLVYPG